MRKIRDIIVNNKLYVILILFILGLNLLVFVDKAVQKQKEAEKTEAVSAEETPKPEEEPKKALFDEDQIKKREQKIADLAKEKPLLYIFLGLVNLTVLFLVLIGFILDGYFLFRWLRRNPVKPPSIEQQPPRWTVGDIVRVTLIFLSFGYIFVILEAFMTNIFPILRNDNFLMVFNTAVMNIVGISVILYFIVKKHGQQISAAGLSLKNFSSNVLCAAVGYVSLIPILLVIMVITFFIIRWLRYQPPVQPIVQVFMEEKETAVLWFSSLFAAIFGPIAEEIYFRGFMYTVLKKRIGILGGMLVSSVVFSFLHAHVVGFFPILALGLLLAYLYEKTGSLVSSMSVHIAHNVAMVIIVFLMRGAGL